MVGGHNIYNCITGFSGRGIRLNAALPFLVLLFLVRPVIAQEFTASVSTNSAAVGDQIEVTFSVNATGKNFKAPTFTDFNVLMGPNQSTQMQIINGSVSQTVSFTYVIQAIREGTFRIGPAEITVGGNKLTTPTLTITVTKGGQQGGSAQSKNQQGGVSGGKNVFIKARIDKSNVYQGEGIAVTYKIYTKVTLLNYSVNKLPSFNGFWSQEISMPQQLEFHNENLDGVNYKVADIKKVILFPQRTGTLTVDPMEGEVIARVQVKRQQQQQQQSNDPFGQFFNDPFFNNPFFGNVQDIKVALKSDPIRINVKELPPGAPRGFTGAVGKFSCETSLEKSEVKAHDAVTLRIKISGKGNIRLIDSPKIDFPPDFETYDPKENVTANATLNGVTGTKTFEYLIIPRNAGNFKIPVEPFSFFDLEKKSYKTIPAPELNLRVGKGSEEATTVITGVNKSDVQMLGKDIRFIKTKTPEFNQGPSTLFNSPSFYAMVTTPALLFAGLLLVRKRNQKMAGNLKLVRSRRANKVAMKRLSAAQKFLASNDHTAFLDEMFRALWGFVSDKLQIPVADLSKESAAEALLRRNVPEELVSSFNATIDECEYARFAGATNVSNENLYKKGIDVISKLENAIG